MENINFYDLHVYYQMQAYLCDGWSDKLILYELILLRGNKNIYLHLISFLHIGMTQVVENVPQVRQ